MNEQAIQEQYQHIVRKRFQNFQPGRHAVTGYHILFVLVQGVVITGGNLIEQADAGLFGKLPGFCQLMPDNKQSLDSALQRHEGTAQYLFLTTWGNSGWTAEEEQEARLYLESELLPVNDLCLFTGAILLSLMECFDPRKFSWLLDAATHADTQVNQRALVIIAIILHIHSNRLRLYPELMAKLSLLDEDGSFGKQLCGF